MEVPLNPKINSLSPYPFSYLSELLKDSKSGRNKIINLSIEYPGYITNARGVGLFCAFDVPSQIERDKLLAKLLENKLLIPEKGYPFFVLLNESLGI